MELLKRDIVFDESSLREISQIINKNSKKREFFENYLSKHNYSICLGEKSSINKQKYLLDKKKIENYFINNQLNIKDCIYLLILMYIVIFTQFLCFLKAEREKM